MKAAALTDRFERLQIRWLARNLVTAIGSMDRSLGLLIKRQQQKVIRQTDVL